MTVLLTDPESRAVPVRECGEPLVPVPHGVVAVGGRPLVRSGLAARLAVAGLLLPPGRRLLVVAGHRPPAEVSGGGDRSPAEVAALAAGAAVDVAMVDRLGRPVDLGPRTGPCAEEEGGDGLDAALSADARFERRLLADALSGAGLVRHPTAWWHWSHGDRIWARATRSPAALHGPIDAPARLRGGKSGGRAAQPISRSATATARSTGTAKPMPMLPEPSVAMEVFTPTTRPSRSTSGPPELPGLMEASVCTIGVDLDRVPRSTALTMPLVTVPFRPSGDPTAMTG